MGIAIVAHRGASGITGEDNTLRSFRLAIDLGCDFVETDARRTRDGRIVYFHDAAVREREVRELTLDELRAASGVDVPTLEEALRLCAGRIGIDVEIKETGYERDVVGIVRECSPVPELARRGGLVVTSFLEEALGRFASLAPDIETGLIVGRPAAEPDATLRSSSLRSTSEAAFAELAARLDRCGAKFLALHHSWLCPDLFETAELAGIPVWAWTVNSPARIAEVLRFPVHAIATDRPDYAAEILRRPARVFTAESVGERASDRDAAGLIASLSGSRVGDGSVPTRHVRTGRGVISETPDWVAALFGSGARVGVVMDRNTRAAAGERVLGMLDAATPVELEPLAGWEHLTPHDTFTELVAARTERCDALVAVGSGTVNDITKYAADRAGKPCVAVATAPSMNGYTSSIAALLVEGLKVTVPCRPPVLVLGDTDVLASAPAEMVRSGYADLMGRPVATADWKMSSLVLGEPFSDLPGAIVDAAIERCCDAAEGIGAREGRAVEVLFQALALSGYAMTLAGTSAPASGGEHLISHLWDMLAYREGRTPALHGLQVGLGALMTARLYEILRREDPARFAPRARTEGELEAIHGDLWPAIADEARKQILSPGEAAARVEKIRGSWEAVWRELDGPSPRRSGFGRAGGLLVTPGELRERLERAGAAVTPSTCGIPPERVRHALLHAADIRARYTVLDLARDTGVLPRAAEEVLKVLEAT